MPSVFVGREDLLAEGVQYILSTPAAWIAILGYGGMGKTTLALAILHQQNIQKSFGNNCYFVPCDVLNSGSDLIYALLHTLESAYAKDKDILSGLHAYSLKCWKNIGGS